MTFSASYTAAFNTGTTDVGVPYGFDDSGNNNSICLYSHVLLTTGTGAGTTQTVFTFNTLRASTTKVTVGALTTIPIALPCGTQTINCICTAAGGGSVTFGKMEA